VTTQRNECQLPRRCAGARRTFALDAEAFAHLVVVLAASGPALGRVRRVSGKPRVHRTARAAHTPHAHTHAHRDARQQL